MVVQIHKVMHRMETGATRPFVCRGEDDQTYYVKGIDARRSSQICEWVAGQLGLAFGLPIAPFEIVDVPAELIDMAQCYPDLELELLGVGPAFGSLHQEGEELTTSVVQSVPAEIRKDLLVFDWWIRNDDRLLTEHGGNPNLLWDSTNSQLVVIDHNLAFHPKFDPGCFQTKHVFVSNLHDVFSDVQQRQEYHERLAQVFSRWPEIKNSIPQEWFYFDSEMTMPVDFNLNEIERILAYYQQDDFWRVQ